VIGRWCGRRTKYWGCGHSFNELLITDSGSLQLLLSAVLSYEISSQ
jgi:hypothetical protein